MDAFKLNITLTLTGAGVISCLLCFLGSKLGKLPAKWAAIVGAVLTACISTRTLAGSWPALPTLESLDRGIWSAIAIGILTVAMSFKKVPAWLRATVGLLAITAALLWVFWLYVPTGKPIDKAFLLDWVGVSVGILLITWLMVEPIALLSPGPAAPLIVGFVAAGFGVLTLLSTSTKPGTVIGAVGASLAGALVAGIFARQISFARGPIWVWICTLALLYVPVCYDADNIPWKPILLILAGPLLAWIVEVPWLKQRKLWQRELLRAALIATPTVAGIFFGYKDKQARGDDMVQVPQSAAPMCPSQMPIPNTIIPPTIT